MAEWEVHKTFWLKNVDRIDHFGDVILKVYCKKILCERG
jgi:S-adenosylmethionine hydrolase